MAVGTASNKINEMLPSLGTPHWVAIIGLLALGLIVGMHFGFKPLNLH